MEKLWQKFPTGGLFAIIMLSLMLGISACKLFPGPAPKPVQPPETGRGLRLPSGQDRSLREPGKTGVPGRQSKLRLVRWKLISSCETNISGSTPQVQKARKHNIEVTLRSLNGTIINKGSVFSFNGKVGEPTIEKGYVNAPIIGDNGRPVPGIGGGMCQVSSTLYNAALQAKLEIVERHPHSKPVSYVPPGKDATVYVDKDLKFRNNQEASLQLRGRVIGDRLQLQLYRAK